MIHRLLDEAEEQVNREVMLAYFFLWREAPAEGWTPDELDRRVEQFLRDEAEAAIDFEVADALDKLRRFQIVPIASALGRIEPISSLCRV